MQLKFNKDGLIPVIAQDFKTKEVLMLAYMNEQALEKTVETGQVHYYSRSRDELWLKGETSGHFQKVIEIRYDCDQDSLLVFVEQTGVACHTGEKSCFFRKYYNNPNEINNNQQQDPLKFLYGTVEERKQNPKEGSYTNYLFDKGIDKILKKVGEETTEIVIAAKNQNKDEIVYEVADLMYHLSVMLCNSNVTWEDIYSELEKRRS